MEEAKKLDEASLDDLMQLCSAMLNTMERASSLMERLDPHTREFVASLMVGVAGETACLSAALTGERAALEGIMAGMDQRRFDQRISLFGLCTVVAVDKKLRAGLREEDEPCC